ncbi:MAG: hypothetical protein ABW072_18075 [Sedimenticola sp.]
MKVIVSLQIIIFLFVSPILLADLDANIDYRFDVATAFAIFFVIGVLMATQLSSGMQQFRPVYGPRIPSWFILIVIALTAIYILTVIQNDLFYRRQGSEVMALKYSTLSFYSHTILRIYEIIYYPVLLVTLASLPADRRHSLRWLLFFLFVGFIFTGVSDSRSKLLIPLVFYYVLFIAPKPILRPIPRSGLITFAVVLIVAVAAVGVSRLEAFKDVSDYFVYDFLKRTDGLEFVSIVSSSTQIPFFGTLDNHIFSNFIAMLPFLEISMELKEAGLTSSKSYLLQVVVGSESIDTNNSVLTDPFYYGGFIGLTLAGLIYGYCVGSFDRLVKNGGIWKNRFIAALLMSFLLNAIRIENDLFGMVFLIARDFLIVYLLFFMFRFPTPAFMKAYLKDSNRPCNTAASVSILR